MSTTIEDRCILLLREESGDSTLDDPENSGLMEKIKSTLAGTPISKQAKKHGFWENLDRRTGISSQRWRKVYTRRQRPTPDMIEELAKMFPSYAFWLATGITDSVNGHTAPMTAQTFPERLYGVSFRANQYFQAQLELTDVLFEEAGVDESDDKQRMFAAERTRPLAHWWDSGLCNTAYKIAATEEYEKVVTLWEKREEERNSLLNRIKSAKPDSDASREKNSPRSTEVIGVDPRTRHQGQCDLFYRPLADVRHKFAKSILNIAPAMLSDEQISQISTMSFGDVEKYITHHGLDMGIIYSSKSGTIRYTDAGLNDDEKGRLTEELQQQRNSRK